MDRAKQQAELRDKWTCIIEDCQESPLTVLEFARQNNITESSLYYWTKQLGIPLKNKPQPTMGFIELKPIPHKAETAEMYPVEMGGKGFTIKMEIPWARLIELIKELG